MNSQLAAKLQGIFVDTDLHLLLEHLMAPLRKGKVNQNGILYAKLDLR